MEGHRLSPTALSISTESGYNCCPEEDVVMLACVLASAGAKRQELLAATGPSGSAIALSLAY